MDAKQRAACRHTDGNHHGATDEKGSLPLRSHCGNDDREREIGGRGRRCVPRGKGEPVEAGKWVELRTGARHDLLDRVRECPLSNDDRPHEQRKPAMPEHEHDANGHNRDGDHCHGVTEMCDQP